MRVCESSKLQSVFFFASQTLDEVAVRVAGGVRGRTAGIEVCHAPPHAFDHALFMRSLSDLLTHPSAHKATLGLGLAFRV
jgi:hypothetical protein